MSLIWFALAFGIATTLMTYFASAKRYESFLGSLQYGPVYILSHALFTTAIFSGLFYVLLLIGRLVASRI